MLTQTRAWHTEWEVQAFFAYDGGPHPNPLPKVEGARGGLDGPYPGEARGLANGVSLVYYPVSVYFN
jgi:hypothetical protein